MMRSEKSDWTMPSRNRAHPARPNRIMTLNTVDLTIPEESKMTRTVMKHSPRNQHIPKDHLALNRIAIANAKQKSPTVKPKTPKKARKGKKFAERANSMQGFLQTGKIVLQTRFGKGSRSGRNQSTSAARH